VSPSSSLSSTRRLTIWAQMEASRDERVEQAESGQRDGGDVVGEGPEQVALPTTLALEEMFATINWSGLPCGTSITGQRRRGFLNPWCRRRPSILGDSQPSVLRY
jgi:hypothetical protein